MLTIDVPGVGMLQLEHLVIDLNGTVAVDGDLVEGVTDVVRSLSPLMHVVLLTADTHGRAARIGETLGCDVRVIGRGREAEAKLDIVDELGSDTVVAVGNGANDALMLADAAFGVAVIGPEGASAAAVMAADVIVNDILDGLRLLADPPRLIATLRR